MNPQRYLALCGLGARRACEALIRDRRVTVNGGLLTFGMQIAEGDDVRLDGQPVAPPKAHIYIMLHKPAGLVSDHADPSSPSALDLPGLPRGLHAVGRLDKDATGFLLLTNDGELSQRLTHPRYEHEKEYEVWVDGAPTEGTLQRWRDGLVIYGSTGTAEETAPAKIAVVRRKGDATLLRVVLHEGKKRQIKRVAKALGHPVQALKRVRIGAVHLDASLAPGDFRPLNEREFADLREQTRA
jgi:pseudouridine synthase